MAGDELARRGWHLSEEGFQQCSEHGKRGADQTVKNALDTDLKEIGEKWLPEQLSRGRLDYLQGPAVLQVQKLRNISAPKENESSQAAPRLMKLSLTDGHMTCVGIETENLKNIGLNTAPGTKVLLDGTVDVENSFLLLSNKNFKLLGGRVDQIAENWEFKMKLAKQNRSNILSEGGPPPFVPFGKKIQQVVTEVKKEKKENFKSLVTNKETIDTTEFDHQRQATIAEALQAKEGGKGKSFGGGSKLVVSDKDLARIVEMGFSADQAMEALKQTNGDVAAATHALLATGDDRDRGRAYDRNNRFDRNDRSDRFERNVRSDRPTPIDRGDRFDRGDRGDRPGSDRGDRFERTDRGDRLQGGDRGNRFDKGDRSDRMDRKDQKPGGRGRRREEDVEDGASSRPSGPATLFDFLTSKIPVKEENKENGTGEVHSNSANKGSRSNTENRHSQSYSSSNSFPSKPTHSVEDFPSHNFTNHKQNLPPRLANKTSREANPRKDDFSNNQYPSQQRRNDSSQSHYNNSLESQNSSSSRTANSERNQSRPATSNAAQNRQQNSSRPHFRQEDRSQNVQYDARQDSHLVKDRDSNTKDRQTDRQSENQKWTDNSGRSNPNEGQDSWPQDRRIWKDGDMCMAKYWEDNQFYHSRIEAMAPPHVGTCVVTFLEYGNAEEVLLSDIRPLSKQNWPTNGPQQNYGQFYSPPRNPRQQNFFVPPPQMPISNPPAYVEEDVLTNIGTMEFRRGGMGTYDRTRQPKAKPSQRLYQPPAFQSHQNS